MSLVALLFLAPAVAALHVGVGAPLRSRVCAPKCSLAGEAFDSDAAHSSLSVPPADLTAAAQAATGGAEGERRVAVSGLTPDGEQAQQQQYVGVPPASAQPKAPSMMSKARTPFMGLTLVATAAVAAWQSNRMYVSRQSALIDEFAATMVFYLGDEREMAAALSSFRKQVSTQSYLPAWSPARACMRPR